MLVRSNLTICSSSYTEPLHLAYWGNVKAHGPMLITEQGQTCLILPPDPVVDIFADISLCLLALQVFCISAFLFTVRGAVLFRRAYLSVNNCVVFTNCLSGLKYDVNGRIYKKSWPLVLVMGLGIAPISSRAGPVDLYSGLSLTYSDGYLDVKSSMLIRPLEHVFKTGSWEGYSSVDKYCGGGGCGSSEDCARDGYWGKSHANGTQHKFCEAHKTTEFITSWCALGWMCWKTMLSYNLMEEFSVYNIGPEILKLDIHRHGPTADRFRVEPVQGLVVSHDYLVAGVNGLYVCPLRTNIGIPKFGGLGDLQITTGGAVFPWTLVMRETHSFSSSGKIYWPESFTKSLMNEQCERIDDTWELSEMEDGSIIQTKASIVVAQMEDQDSKEADGLCFNGETNIYGNKGASGLRYILIKADSRNGSHSLVLNNSCLPQPLELECNGLWHYVQLLVVQDDCKWVGHMTDKTAHVTRHTIHEGGVIKSYQRVDELGVISWLTNLSPTLLTLIVILLIMICRR